MTLPPQLRQSVYGYIALSHTTRRVRIVHSKSVGTSMFKTTTAAITATCRLVHEEYEAVARKVVTSIEFTVMNMNFNHVIGYFCREVDATYLANLQSNKATIQINMAIRDRSFNFDMGDFYIWAVFLIGVQLQPAYVSDRATWMDIFESPVPDLTKWSVVEEDSAQIIRGNIGGIRKVAKEFDKALWRAYSTFRVELQARRHREWDRRAASRALTMRDLNAAG